MQLIISALITLPAKQYPTDDYHEGSANDDGFGPTTQDSLFEFNPPLHPEISVVNTDCAGTINENGDCVGMFFILKFNYSSFVYKSSIMSDDITKYFRFKIKNNTFLGTCIGVPLKT